MNSTTSNFTFSSNGTNSTPNTSQSTLHIVFHVNTSPFVQLNASFLALSVTDAHICCSASTLASDTSQKCSQLYLLPTYLHIIDQYVVSTICKTIMQPHSHPYFSISLYLASTTYKCSYYELQST
ncbi:hypothetical protein Hanom_Chr02g00124021 [Helianthus anomalus]